MVRAAFEAYRHSRHSDFAMHEIQYAAAELQVDVEFLASLVHEDGSNLWVVQQ